MTFNLKKTQIFLKFHIISQLFAVIEPLFSFFKRLEELKRLYLEKKEIFKSIAFVNEMQSHLKDLKHQMAWAVVNILLKYVCSCEMCFVPSLLYIC